MIHYTFNGVDLLNAFPPLLLLLMQHVPASYPKDFPLPSACTDIFKVCVEYLDQETKVWLHVDPATIHLPSMVS